MPIYIEHMFPLRSKSYRAIMELMKLLDRLKFLLQTPTFAGSLLGGVALAMWGLTSLSHMDVVAWLVLTPVGLGGCAIALAFEVKEDMERWGWKGLGDALSRPSPMFLLSFFGHVPQALVGLGIGLYWRFG